MNLKHDLETPISTLKTIFALLKEDGVLSQRMEDNANRSFERIKEILEEWNLDDKKCKKSEAKNIELNL